MTDTEVRVDLPRDDPKPQCVDDCPAPNERSNHVQDRRYGEPQGDKEPSRMTCTSAASAYWRPLPQCAATRPEVGEPRVILHRQSTHKSLTGLVTGSSTPAHPRPLARLTGTLFLTFSLFLYINFTFLIHPPHLPPSHPVFLHDVRHHQGSRSPG